MMARTLERSRESMGHISSARLLLATRSTHRGCVSQTIFASGNEPRNAATAGNVCTMSPREPKRTTRKRGSGMRCLADRVKQSARGMVFRIADNGHPDAEARCDSALGYGLGGVVRALGVHVGPQFFQEFFHVRLGENQNIVHNTQGRNQ